MKMIIVTIRDVKADLFMRPFFMQTSAAAIRTFSDEVNRADKDNTIYNHPEDYSLYEIGEFDDNTAVIYPLPQPRMLIQASQCSLQFTPSTDKKVSVY